MSGSPQHPAYVRDLKHKTRICTQDDAGPAGAVMPYAAALVNHRFGLDAMLIKDNHIAVAGSIRRVPQRARRRRSFGQIRLRLTRSNR
jgi:hypothetical protein